MTEHSNEKSAFYEALHCQYIIDLQKQNPSIESCMLEHLRMSGVYWGLTSMAIMNRLEEMQLDKVYAFVLACAHPNGGFSGNVHHDPHLLYTCHAILILAVCRRLDLVPNREKTIDYVLSLQLKDGSFVGDEWQEVDLKYTYCALLILSLLKAVDRIDKVQTARFISTCQNFDNGYGNLPFCESHGGHIFCAIGALSMLNQITAENTNEEINALGWWLAERQCDSGGLNGRPEKQADVCYSFWNISSLVILHRLDWISKSKLMDFILSCQDEETGSIADRPKNQGDIYHTFFGMAGLTLLGYFDQQKQEGKYKEYRTIHPVYAIPMDIVQELQLEAQILPLDTNDSKDSNHCKDLKDSKDSKLT